MSILGKTLLFCLLGVLAPWCLSCSSGSSTSSPEPTVSDEVNPPPAVIAETPPSNQPGPQPQASLKPNSPYATKVTMGPVSSDDAFSLEIVKRDLKGLAGQLWWIEKTFEFPSRGSEENRLNTEMVLQDLRECGFSLFGPNCIDSQKINVSPLVTLNIDQKPYIFLVFTYRMVKLPYAVFLALEDDDSHFVGKKIFLYELSELRSTYSPHSVLKETLGKAVGVFDTVSLDQENASDFLKQTHNLRKQLYLMKWLAANPGSLDPQKIALVRDGLVADLKTMEGDILELGNANQFYLFLKTLQIALPGEGYLKYLRSQDNIPSLGLKSEVCIELLLQGEPLSASLLNTLKDAFTRDNVLTVLRALDVVVARKEEFPTAFFAKVIPLLDAEETEISNRADLALTNVEITEDLLPLVGKLIKRKGRNDNVLKYALKILDSAGRAGLSKAYEMILTELSNKDEEIRNEVYWQAVVIEPSNEFLPVLQNQILACKEIRILEFIIDWVNRLDTSEATAFLIGNLWHEDVAIIQKIMKLVPTRRLFPEHLDSLLTAYEHRDVDGRLENVILLSLIRLDMPRGLNPILHLIRTSPDQAKVEQYIGLTKESHFGPENLDELDLGVLNPNDVVKVACIEIVLKIDDFRANDILIKKANLMKEGPLLDRILETLDQRDMGGNNAQTLKDQWMGYSNKLKDKGLEFILRSQGPVASKVMAGMMVDSNKNIRESAINELDTREPVREMWSELILNIMGGRVDEVIGGKTIFSSASYYPETIAASFRYLRPLVSETEIDHLLIMMGSSGKENVLTEFHELLLFLYEKFPDSFVSPEFIAALSAVIHSSQLPDAISWRSEGQVAVIRLVAALGNDILAQQLEKALLDEEKNLDPNIYYAIVEAIQ